MKGNFKLNAKFNKSAKKTNNLSKIAKPTNLQTHSDCKNGVCTVTWKPKAS